MVSHPVRASRLVHPPLTTRWRLPLRREVKKEKRGAVRELRKDNRFLAETVAREREAAADERGERQRETLSFLEKMESDLKSGGQGGMIVKNQRRVNGPPKRDRKKR